ncbi:hypothetical protein [Streptomyces sp. NPDC016845]|uniref:hypothetical protein n=1 Tax=Streptomyces sp. NPDC016845 TaxID=3364972 RepID=UPI00378A7C10
MTDTHPGPDEAELRIRKWMNDRGLGLTPEETAALPPKPTHLPDGYQPAPPPDDWWNSVYGPDGASPIEDAPVEPVPAPNAEQSEGEGEGDAEDDEQKPAAPRKTRTPRESPRRALAEAAPNLAPRMRWLLLHATAAAAGYPFGLVTWGTDTAAWFAAARWTNPSAWGVYLIAAFGLALYRSTRRSTLLFAWLGAIPVSSVALGVLLYGTP